MQVCILLDRSGSMNTIWDEAINSVNAYVAELTPDTKINFAVFDSQSYDVVRSGFAGDYSKVDPKTILPRGMTPLYDSVRRTINLAESIGDPKTAIVVMTDGFENASRNTSLKDIKDKLQAITDRGWETVFLGANFDKINLVADTLGVARDHHINFTQDTMVMNMVNLGTRTMAYASTGAKIGYSDEDKRKAQQ